MTIKTDFVGHPPRLRYRFAIDVPVYDDQREVISTFAPTPSPPEPIVTIDGPVCLRHRWSNWSLCMWWKTDPRERRWVFGDGLLALVAHIEAHAWCERECRAGKPWPKPEAPGEHPRPRHCPSCWGRGR